MKKIYSLSLIAFTCLSSIALQAQNVGIGTNNPQEKLEVVGAIKIGNTSNDFIGTIRYNDLLDRFEGRVDTGWSPFSGGSGQDDDWVIIVNDMHSGVSGNVGIGTTVPLTKLHVKGSGNIAIRAETASEDYPALDVFNTNGISIRAVSKHDSLPAVEILNQDSLGYALVVINESAIADTVNNELVFREGGNAAKFIGDLSILGAIRNTDSLLYGGSIAINDGLTVGDISGANCITVNPETFNFQNTMGFDPNTIRILIKDDPNPHKYDNIVDADTGDCRKITNLYYEVVIWEQSVTPTQYPIVVGVYVRDLYVGGINVPNGDVYTYPPSPFPSNLDTCIAGDGGFYSTWFFNSNLWNGTDPDNVNFYVHCINQDPSNDTDIWYSYNGNIYYSWGDSSNSPLYAAYGEVRASGKLYANSLSEYGDVAEFFAIEDKFRKPEAGDIVSISTNREQSFVLTSKANDPLIAGVISENPSVFLNDPSQGEAVALTGRVKAKVNLEGGSIKSGDPITSSTVTGVGMKAKSGTIIGYAMEAFDGSRTDEGKIWILLARSEINDLPKQIKVVQGNPQQVGGVLITGSQKVKADESTVFIAWDKQTRQNMPEDVEFDDLVIDLTPFGGKAQLIVTEVSKDGFMVAVESRSANFKGFYYKADIISAEFPEVSSVVSSNAPNQHVYSSIISEGDHLANAMSAYKMIQEITVELVKLTGKDLKNTPTGNIQKIKKFKEDVANSWMNANPELYNEMVKMQYLFSSAANSDPSVMRKMSEMSR